MTEQTQPTDAELMPCPFCGTQPDECDIGQFVVECQSCAIVGPTSDNSDAARRAWNTRWGTPAGAGEVVAVVGTDAGGVHLYYEGKYLGPQPAKKTAMLLKDLPLGTQLFTTPQPTQAQASFKSGAKSFQTYAEANAYSKGYYAGKKAATKAQAGAVPLTVDEVEQLIAQWSYELHGDRARYLVRMTEQHYGIKGKETGNAD